MRKFLIALALAIVATPVSAQIAELGPDATVNERLAYISQMYPEPVRLGADATPEERLAFMREVHSQNARRDELRLAVIAEMNRQYAIDAGLDPDRVYSRRYVYPYRYSRYRYYVNRYSTARW